MRKRLAITFVGKTKFNRDKEIVPLFLLLESCELAVNCIVYIKGTQ